MNEKLQFHNRRLMLQVKKARLSMLCLFGFLYLCTAIGCKDDSSVDDFKLKDAAAFDASRSIKVTNCLPDSGGIGTRVIVYGENFGNDTAAVNVTIGGRKARVLSCRSNSLLCIVPSKAWTGEVKVAVNSETGEEIQSREWENLFKYQSPMVVSTFLGTTYENNTKYDTKPGPFEDCGGFENLVWMKFDPNDLDMLYIAAGTKSFRVVDFKNEYVNVFSHNLVQPTCIDFTLNGDMVVGDDQKDKQAPGLYLFTRESGYTVRQDLCPTIEINSVAVHPTNGRIYFTQYRTGELNYYDLEKREKVLVRTLGKSIRYMFWHPTGKYCYYIDNQEHKIYRMDYNEETKELSLPLVVCGGFGYQDGVGEGAKLNKPQQGIFIKNKKYEGQEDEYDFYFCDSNNGCVRFLTPEGRVETYAGRAENSVGYRDGALRTEAQFKTCQSLVYDYKRNCMYVGDNGNHYIRKISPQDDVE